MIEKFKVQSRKSKVLGLVVFLLLTFNCQLLTASPQATVSGGGSISGAGMVSATAGGIAVLDTNQNFNLNSTTNSYSYSVSSGSNVILIVRVFVPEGHSVTVATWNGHALSLGRQDQSDGTYFTTAIYYLAAPDSGSHTLEIDVDAIGNPGVVMAQTFSGVNQSSPLDGSGNGANAFVNNTSSISASVTAAGTGEMIVDAVHAAAGNFGSFTPDASQTLDGEGYYSNGMVGMGSHKLGTSSGSYTMTWLNNTGSGAYSALSVIALKPA